MLYKKLAMNFVKWESTIGEDSLDILCHFEMSDPSELVRDHRRHNPEEEDVMSPKKYESIRIPVSFPADAEPSKAEILEAVAALQGVVTQYA